MRRPRTPRLFLLLAVIAALPLAAAMASHSWGSYHWKRTSDVLTVDLGSNVSGGWSAHLSTAASDWSYWPETTHVQTRVVSGAGNADCGPVAGRVEICAEAYGENGWLGIASIWLTRGKNAHITAGTVQMNDTYFSMPAYDSGVWRQLVMCQEIGHTLGLDHQDENFSNPPLGTCMDYHGTPTEADAHPNAHDYEQLALIYGHGDGDTTGPKGGPKGKPALGFVGHTALPANAAPVNGDVFIRDLPNGQRVVTFVTWLPE